MKKFLLCLSTAVMLNACAQVSNAEKEFVFNPKAPAKYTFDVAVNSVKMKGAIANTYEQGPKTVHVVSVINEINMDSGMDNAAEINADYQRYVNDSVVTDFDPQGNAAGKANGKRIINPELFVVQFPKRKVTEGDTWEGTKSANPDFMFKQIAVKYKCRKISADHNEIEVEMSYVNEESKGSPLGTMTKIYKGIYVVKDDGTVKSADMDISGFSGISEIKGKMKIELVN